MLSYEAARAKVIEIVRARARKPQTETIWFAHDPASALGRILAENVVADRDLPPFNRATRDGFAVRAADAAQAGAKFRLIGESRAGVAFPGTLNRGECVQIMTGASLPHNADAVVMQEYAHVESETVVLDEPAHAGSNFVFKGSEARAGEVAVVRGARLGYAELAMAAQVGRTRLTVTQKPRVAILSTGDEVVAVEDTPGPFQIRNSNSVSLAAQVALAGGEAILLGNASDDTAVLRAAIERGLEADMLVLSGGVSAGKYDFVEQVLTDLGAEFFFDAVAIRPGKPVVFGWCSGKPVIGCPGNPVSTMVTFEVLAVPAIELMSGWKPQALHLFKAKLIHPVEQKAALTHFLPARVSWPNGQPSVALLPWEGSGDIGAVARGNCFLVLESTHLKLEAGELVNVLLRRGAF